MLDLSKMSDVLALQMNKYRFPAVSLWRNSFCRLTVLSSRRGNWGQGMARDSWDYKDMWSRWESCWYPRKMSVGLGHRGFLESALLFRRVLFFEMTWMHCPFNSCHLTPWLHGSACMYADACTNRVSWQLLSGAKHSSSHKNFAGRRSLENLYGLGF